MNTNKKTSPKLFKTASILGLVFAFFCIVASFNLLSGWEGLGDPEVQKMLSKSRGIYILIPLVIAFWPIVLGVYGLLFILIFLIQLKVDD